MRIKVKQGVIYGITSKDDISRDQLASRVGVSRATMYRIDEDMVDPSPKFIAGLIDATGRTFEDLFDLIREQRIAS